MPISLTRWSRNGGGGNNQAPCYYTISCVYSGFADFITHYYMVHPSQYTLAPPIQNWFLLHCNLYIIQVEIPSLFSTVIGLVDSSVVSCNGGQYFDSSCSATFFLSTIDDLKAVTIASQVGGGSTAVSNQCFNISHIRSV